MTIASMCQQGCSIRAMARMLQRSPSTISRKLARNTHADLSYGSHAAQQACQARRRAARPAPKLHVHGLRWGVVATLLDWKWSPQQIAATLKRAFPHQTERHVSHETSTCPRAPIGACTARTNWTPSPTARTTDRAQRKASTRLWPCSPRCWHDSINHTRQFIQRPGAPGLSRLTINCCEVFS